MALHSGAYSGWRSPEYQSYLFAEGIDDYGSEAKAAQWVATAETSSHVSGDAVDIATYDAISWMAQRGDDYGLCQIYGNESWHYELRAEAIDNGCPPRYADPADDPRLQQ
ncbi:D-alanyl-D-alanine carboxypeptidase family protein [Citricoccus sp. GCM10030269]|uniref:D-alanyl-D-alanine carboxypeptidase family protein n=1 Tax=Citricoccus sp. GCM10030269 TaxID=3273388 RepID=UPI00361FE06D